MQGNTRNWCSSDNYYVDKEEITLILKEVVHVFTTVK
jgi:hypothetical protein